MDYRYDLGGNLSEVVYFAQFIDHNASGQPGAISYANGSTTWFQYNPLNLRLIGLENDSPDWILDSFGYLYDNKGNLTQISSNYTPYNDLTPSTTEYYSHGHNIYYSIKNIPSSDAAIVSQYFSNGNGNPFEIRSSTRYGMEIWFTNDRLITYNADNMPLSITTYAGQPYQFTTSFVYDGNNKRVKKITPPHTRLYIDKLYECVDGDCGKFIFAGNMRLAAILGGQTYYYQPDHQGSTASITDTTGNWVESIAYYPFGETQEDDLAGSVAMTHKYTGQELDDETGLYNYDARLYDPAIGRFLTPDSIVPDFSNPQSLNRYAYVLNNPLRYTDPTGHYFDDSYSDWGNSDWDWGSELGSSDWDWDTDWESEWESWGSTDWSVSLNYSTPDSSLQYSLFDSSSLSFAPIDFGLDYTPSDTLQVAGGGILTAEDGAILSRPSAMGGCLGCGSGQGNLVPRGGGGSSSPDFLVSPNGTAFPVPSGATGPMPVINQAGVQTGTAFTGGSGGLNGQVNSIRIMNPTPPRGVSPGYPNGYIKYENILRQGVDPYSGKTLPNTKSHFPLFW